MVDTGVPHAHAGCAYANAGCNPHARSADTGGCYWARNTSFGYANGPEWFLPFFERRTVTIKYLLPALLAGLALPAGAVDYEIDPSHTYATFEIDHMGFSTQRGLFRRTSGQIRYDPEARSGTIEIRIDAASLDTGFGLRDDVLRGSRLVQRRRAFPTSSSAASA